MNKLSQGVHAVIDRFFSYVYEYTSIRLFFFYGVFFFSCCSLLELFLDLGAFNSSYGALIAVGLMIYYGRGESLHMARMDQALGGPKAPKDVYQYPMFLSLSLIFSFVSAYFSSFEVMHVLMCLGLGWGGALLTVVQASVTLGLFRYFLQRYLAVFEQMCLQVGSVFRSTSLQTAWNVYSLYFRRRFDPCYRPGRAQSSFEFFSNIKNIKLDPFSSLQIFIMLTLILLGPSYISVVLVYGLCLAMCMSHLAVLFSGNLYTSCVALLLLSIPASHSLLAWAVCLNVCAFYVYLYPAFFNPRVTREDFVVYFREMYKGVWEALYHEHAFIEALYPAVGLVHMYAVPAYCFPIIFLFFYVTKSLYLGLLPFDFVWVSPYFSEVSFRQCEGEDEVPSDMLVRCLHASSDVHEFHHAGSKNSLLASAVVGLSSFVGSRRCCG